VGRYVWGVDGETLGGAVGNALVERGWRLATAEGLTGGELARSLTEAEPDGWYAGGVVRPGAPSADLYASVTDLGADVILVTERASSGEPTVRVRTPTTERSAVARAGSAPEARRRAVLTALDLALRAIGRGGSDPT
jgi:hypothetical protein